jgi:hypothetical protein
MPFPDSSNLAWVSHKSAFSPPEHEKNVDHPMNAKVEPRVIIKFLSNEGADATEIHDRLLRAFQEILTPFPVFMNRSRPSKLGVQLSETSIGPAGHDSITSIPKFYQYFKKVNP